MQYIILVRGELANFEVVLKLLLTFNRTSMTTLHPFPTSRESVLQIWSVAAQTKRSAPDSSVEDLFVLLHGMLFTGVQLDDFPPTLARFMERLQLEGAEERDWIMMAVVNITALLEFGKPTGVLRSTGGIGSGATGRDASSAAQAAAATAKVNMLVKKVDEMEVDDAEDAGTSPVMREQEINMKGNGVLNVSPLLANAQAVNSERTEPPLAFKYALQLTFEMFAYTLRNPMRKATRFSRPTLNPYNTVLITFLATVMKHSAVQRVLERAIPWEDLAAFFCTIPRAGFAQVESGVRLTSGCSPLPEDWCLRGMEWGGRRVFERGFWKGGEDRHMEIEILDAREDKDTLTDGIIESEDEADRDASGTSARWIRIARAAGILAKTVPGFRCDASSRTFAVSGVLKEKVNKWREEDNIEREEEERRRTRRPWRSDDMDVDDEGNDFADDLSDDGSESSSDGEESEEVKALKVRKLTTIS